ncbi:hypothetical protein EV646_10926 [Kribbella antiqua]|uniref:Uncharacterized protein n=1 Tax=Kribbella antiqua TaxID=2512217 RepID=A0A4R2IQ17_9ACTN|nr:hypothetical protein [Kribbella antiqua]TCO44855.1 hypothetical protein EV646_10926 [Kribbella antiqua]
MNARKLLCAIVSTAGLVVASLVCTGGPAAAALIEHQHVEDVRSFVDGKFCGDLRVRIDIDVRIHLLVKTQGPDGLVYFLESLRGTTEFTNLATGKSFTNFLRIVNKDLKVTDNGDGTLTVLTTTNGVVKNYGPDGELLFIDSGTFRVELLIDHGGTPTDPDDDEILSETVVKTSTGRSDTEGHDFCEDFRLITS